MMGLSSTYLVVVGIILASIAARMAMKSYAIRRLQNANRLVDSMEICPEHTIIELHKRYSKSVCFNISELNNAKSEITGLAFLTKGEAVDFVAKRGYWYKQSKGEIKASFGGPQPATESPVVFCSIYKAGNLEYILHREIDYGPMFGYSNP